MNHQQLKKRFENFWYYYKIPAMAVIIILLIGIYFHLSAAKTVDYDYEIALAATEAIDDTVLDELKASIIDWFSDRNGDGEVLINIVPYIFEQGDNVDPQRAMTTQVQFLGDMELGKSPLYIYTKKFYDLYMDEGIFPEDAADRIPLKESVPDLPSQLEDACISLFDYERIDEGQRRSIDDVYKDCQDIIDTRKASAS